jgi:hypothetical protein
MSLAVQQAVPDYEQGVEGGLSLLAGHSKNLDLGHRSATTGDGKPQANHIP